MKHVWIVEVYAYRGLKAYCWSIIGVWPTRLHARLHASFIKDNEHKCRVTKFKIRYGMSGVDTGYPLSTLLDYRLSP